MPLEKSPIGLMPRHIHDKMRLSEIIDAIDRYKEANKAVPYEWYEEAYEIFTKYGYSKDHR